MLLSGDNRGECNVRRERGEGRREGQACDCNTRGTTVVIERDRCEIEKETGRRGAGRLCSETCACLINDIDKTVNRERNSLPSVIYSCARWTDMNHNGTRFGILSRLVREKNSIPPLFEVWANNDKLEYVIESGGCNFSYFYIFYCYCTQYNSNIITHLIKNKSNFEVNQKYNANKLKNLYSE